MFCCKSCCKVKFESNIELFNHYKKCSEFRYFYKNQNEYNIESNNDNKDNNNDSIYVVKQLFAEQKRELDELKNKLEELSKKKNIVVYNTNNITLIAYNKNLIYHILDK